MKKRKERQAYAVYLTNGLLYDKLHTLAAEYTMPVEKLAELAVERLLRDVEMVRGLRTGKCRGHKGLCPLFLEVGKDRP